MFILVNKDGKLLQPGTTVWRVVSLAFMNVIYFCWQRQKVTLKASSLQTYPREGFVIALQQVSLLEKFNYWPALMENLRNKNHKPHKEFFLCIQGFLIFCFVLQSLFTSVLNYLGKSHRSVCCFSERARAGSVGRSWCCGSWSVSIDAPFPGSVCTEETAWVLVCATAAEGRRGLG